MNVAAGTRETMISDIQGSIIGMLDSGGTLAKTGYQPYGENPALTAGTFQYTARRFDPETAGSTAQPSGLYYYRARTYSPTWGRFLQPDPIGYAGGANLYAYVHNDPLNLTDPLGLCDNPQGCGGSSSQLVAPDAITPVYPLEYAIGIVTGSGVLRTLGGAIVRQFLLDPTAAPAPPSTIQGNTGDLTRAEINQIQSVVNQAGRPIEVVGSAARAGRQPGSDIDYVAPPSSLQYFEGLEKQLPGLDPTHGIIPGVGNANIGPVIRFEPQ